MKHTWLIILIMNALGTSAYAGPANSITCAANGDTFGITRIVGYSDDADATGTIFSHVTVKGSSSELPLFTTNGVLAQEFQVGPEFYRAWDGIKKVYLVKSADGYVLNTRTFCNFYYQEEKCSEGELLEESTDKKVHCSLDW